MRKISEAFYRVTLQPKALAAWAVATVIAFGVVRALGWREFTMVLSGTFPLGASEGEAALKAGAYLLCYFGTVVAAPILLLGAAINLVLERLIRLSKGVR